MKEDLLLLKNNHYRHNRNSNGITKSYPPPLTPSMATAFTSANTGALLRVMVWLILFVGTTYLIYALKLISSPSCSTSDHSLLSISISTPQNLSLPKTQHPILLAESSNINVSPSATKPVDVSDDPTSLRHVAFGIAASSRLWDKRKEYIKLWWRPRQMRGVVWLDKPVNTSPSEKPLLPPIKISGDTASFAYTNKKGHRSAIRISRIVAETLRLGLPDVRWFVMGDDDTIFLADNLVGVLSRFDHRQYYYIGSISESHLQNIYFSFGMAYGGGGFAVSYPLAVALSKMQDRCIQRYRGLYGSDDRMQACMSELGVPLTRHPGFHQYDVYGDLFGLLAAHPVAPLVTLHHLDVVEPVFPNETRVGALGRIFAGPVKLDSAAVMQQSICYDRSREWTVSVSWGFAVQVVRGILSPREMEMPARTFLNWHPRADYTAYGFNTRPAARNPCQRPFVYYLQSSTLDRRKNMTTTNYGPGRLLVGGGGASVKCPWKTDDPVKTVDVVVVHKRPDPLLWKRSPRRNCCRVLKDEKGRKRTMTIDVGVCNDGEIIVI